MVVKDRNQIPGLRKALPGILDKAAMQAGFYLEGKILEKIDRGGDGDWLGLHPFTVSRKKSSKILVDTGQIIRNQLTTRMEARGMRRIIKVGLFHGKAWISAVHEYGVKIRVTERMRAYLASQGLHLRKSTTVITIPERSFLRSTTDEQEEKIIARAKKVIAREFKRFSS
jgi:hypothetical protein